MLFASTPGSAACLDYFDAAYAKIDLDGEYAGFTLSGHILRNESIQDMADPELVHCPKVLGEPLAIIRQALRHQQRQFLSQPVVHRYMRSEWVAGGTMELSYAEPWVLYREVLFWLFGGWALLLYNGCLFAISACIPPFEHVYSKWIGIHEIQSHERLRRALPFVPAFKYALHAVTDFLLAFYFIQFRLMPYFETVDGYEEPVFVPAFRLDSFGIWHVSAYAVVSGSLLKEAERLYHVMFQGLELGQLWMNALLLFAEVAEEGVQSFREAAASLIGAPSRPVLPLGTSHRAIVRKLATSLDAHATPSPVGSMVRVRRMSERRAALATQSLARRRTSACQRSSSA